ncbi:protein SEED AND ROOT HAIR PROTECTIVE PROTEIN-like [Cornus florida]|uniref:protein SEED AND ROOT HAIR PROTECTIVE PROTEIN-like n=1 Tax=Cornus florida TaxID=4283 RepID=UPI00289C0F14|nr:protein SEED AND ROOT HAIR PROTECTIVE PROTEIN-like [Cornus florida]
MALTTSSLAISMLLFSLVVVASANGYGYAPKPKLDKYPKAEDKLLPKIIGIQGIIYCKSGSKLIPLQGAVARVTCLAVDQHGCKPAPITILSCPTDAKGYFLATLFPSQLEDASKLKECKAFLENSPLETCKVPTDVNKGISGAPLSSSHLLSDKHMKLSSVGPFVYTSKSRPISKGY